MKKQALAALAIMGATMGMGAVPQNVPTANQQSPAQSQKHNDAVDRQITTVRRGPVTPLNPAGIGEYSFINSGRSPKEYGMYLQQTGRQKWVKKRQH